MEQPGKKFEPPNPDSYGVLAIIQAHFELALQHSHPVQALKTACKAGFEYFDSYSFIEVSAKGSAVPEYRMVRKREIVNESGGKGAV